MRPGLLGVFVSSVENDEGERVSMAASAAELAREFPGYKVSMLFVGPAGPKTAIEEREFGRLKREMQRDGFEIMVVTGSRHPLALNELFCEVPPDVEVVNNTQSGSDLDSELRGRFRSENRCAVRFVREMAQALA